MSLSRDRLIDGVLARSPAAQWVLLRVDHIEAVLCGGGRRIWPVAQVARLFDISERLLWRWVGIGLLSPVAPPRRWLQKSGGGDLKEMKKGLRVEEIRGFLRELRSRQGITWVSACRRSRPAAQKCLAVAAALRPGERMRPQELAMRAGVSAATVYRLMKAGWLPIRQVTRRCRWIEGRGIEKIC